MVTFSVTGINRRRASRRSAAFRAPWSCTMPFGRPRRPRAVDHVEGQVVPHRRSPPVARCPLQPPGIGEPARRREVERDEPAAQSLREAPPRAARSRRAARRLTRASPRPTAVDHRAEHIGSRRRPATVRRRRRRRSRPGRARRIRWTWAPGWRPCRRRRPRASRAWRRPGRSGRLARATSVRVPRTRWRARIGCARCVRVDQIGKGCGPGHDCASPGFGPRLTGGSRSPKRSQPSPSR